MTDQTTSAHATPVEELSFKEGYNELSEIVRQLEEGNLELEDSIALYARGVELLGSLRTRLSAAELKVNDLMNKIDAPQGSERA